MIDLSNDSWQSNLQLCEDIETSKNRLRTWIGQKLNFGGSKNLTFLEKLALNFFLWRFRCKMMLTKVVALGLSFLVSYKSSPQELTTLRNLKITTDVSKFIYSKLQRRRWTLHRTFFEIFLIYMRSAWVPLHVWSFVPTNHSSVKIVFLGIRASSKKVPAYRSLLALCYNAVNGALYNME